MVRRHVERQLVRALTPCAAQAPRIASIRSRLGAELQSSQRAGGVLDVLDAAGAARPTTAATRATSLGSALSFRRSSSGHGRQARPPREARAQSCPPTDRRSRACAASNADGVAALQRAPRPKDRRAAARRAATIFQAELWRLPALRALPPREARNASPPNPRRAWVAAASLVRPPAPALDATVRQSAPAAPTLHCPPAAKRRSFQQLRGSPR